MKKAIQRIIKKDIPSVREKLLNENGIFVEFDETNVLQAYALLIGPQDSVYNHGFLLFDIKFPKNYPYSPPDIVYCPSNKIRIHPNLYAHGGRNGMGKVCLSILGTWHGPKWTSVMDIGDVLLSILSILDKNPLANEPGYEKSVSPIMNIYSNIIHHETYATLLIKNAKMILDPGSFWYSYFHEPVLEYLQKKQETIQEDILSFQKTCKHTKITTHLYNIRTYMIDKTLDIQLNSIYSQINNKV
jgi:ubiquitin-protein ligase